MKITNYKTAIKKCNKLSRKYKSTYRVIKEYQQYFIKNDAEYQSNWQRYCVDEEYDMRLIYTRQYEEKYMNFKDACKKADEKAEKYGGVWHVIEIIVRLRFFRRKKIYIEVSKFYFNTHTKAKSVYKSKDGGDMTKYLKELGLTKEEIKNLTKNK